MQRGFTLIELIVVMAIIALLLSLAAPRYFRSLDSAAEVVLRTNLRTLRDAIDKYQADTGQYPPSLGVLVDAQYLREIPIDPILDSRSGWLLLPHPGGRPGIYDVRSSSNKVASDGSRVEQW